MGFVFPVYANFFVEWKEGYFIYFLLGCIMAGITVGIVSYRFVKIILIKELLKVSEVATSIAKKDLDISLDIESNDAVGEIAKGFKEVLSSLNFLVARIHAITTQVTDLGGIDQNYSNSDGTIEDLRDTIENVKENADSISQLSDSIRDEVRQIQTSVVKSGKQLGSIDMLVTDFKTMMESLTVQTDKINQIVKFVNDVASQTNILALNASIEASKAGAFGRSFGVVAGEVQKLSSNIGDSVAQINKIVFDLNVNIESANELNSKITSLFKDNLTENLKFSEIINKVDMFASENLKENIDLKQVVLQLSDTVTSINEKFKSFNKSIVALDESVANYKLNT